MSTEKIIEYVTFIVFGAFAVWALKAYIQLKTAHKSAKESDVTMGELEEHCIKMQRMCAVHHELENIKLRLETGDRTLEKHTEAIPKLDITGLSEMIKSSMVINSRVIAMLDHHDEEKNKIIADINDLQSRTDFLKNNRPLP